LRLNFKLYTTQSSGWYCSCWKNARGKLERFWRGEIPVLHEDAQPHWELVKKYDIIDFELEIKLLVQDFQL
jgi:hypothetical protein